MAISYVLNFTSYLKYNNIIDEKQIKTIIVYVV